MLRTPELPEQRKPSRQKSDQLTRPGVGNDECPTRCIEPFSFSPFAPCFQYSRVSDFNCGSSVRESHTTVHDQREQQQQSIKQHQRAAPVSAVRSLSEDVCDAYEAEHSHSSATRQEAHVRYRELYQDLWYEGRSHTPSRGSASHEPEHSSNPMHDVQCNVHSSGQFAQTSQAISQSTPPHCQYQTCQSTSSCFGPLNGDTAECNSDDCNQYKFSGMSMSGQQPPIDSWTPSSVGREAAFGTTDAISAALKELTKLEEDFIDLITRAVQQTSSGHRPAEHILSVYGHLGALSERIICLFGSCATPSTGKAGDPWMNHSAGECIDDRCGILPEDYTLSGLVWKSAHFLPYYILDHVAFDIDLETGSPIVFRTHPCVCVLPDTLIDNDGQGQPGASKVFKAMVG